MEKRDVDREQDERPIEHEGQQRQAGDGDMDGEDVRHGFRQIVEDSPPLPDALDERRKIIVEEDERGGFACHVGSSLSHGEPDMRGPQRGGVVHAVAGHGDDLPVGLEAIHQA